MGPKIMGTNVTVRKNGTAAQEAGEFRTLAEFDAKPRWRNGIAIRPHRGLNVALCGLSDISPAEQCGRRIVGM